MLGSRTATFDRRTEANNENLKALVREQKQGQDQNKNIPFKRKVNSRAKYKFKYQ